MGVSKILLASLSHHRRSSTCASAADRLLPHPPDLIKWVREIGGFVHQAVTIGRDGARNCRGLVSNQDIPKGSALIRLPLRIPLQFESSWESDYGAGVHPVLARLAQRIPAHLTEELWAMKLGLKLLQERATVGSFWWPYISNLPKKYNTLPIFFSEEDKKSLQYAPLIHKVNKRCQFLLDFEQEVKRCLEDLKENDHPFGGQDIDASSLGWAMSAVSSRAFHLHCRRTDGTLDEVPMMVPLIDMCNHSFSPNTQLTPGRDSCTREFYAELVAETLIKQNDALLLDYSCFNLTNAPLTHSCFSNDTALLNYGFVIPSNPHDCIELRYDEALMDAASTAAGVSSPYFSSPSPLQKKILSELNLHGKDPDLEVTIGGKDLVDGRLLAALRVLLSNEIETVHEYDLDTLKSLSADAPLGVANEVAVCSTLIRLLADAFDSGCSTVKEDEWLANQRCSVSKLLAIQFRLLKKLTQIDTMILLARRVKSLLSEDKTMSHAFFETGAENERDRQQRRRMQIFCSMAAETRLSAIEEWRWGK